MGKTQLKWLLCACVLVVSGCSGSDSELVSGQGQGNPPSGTSACGISNPCKNDEICTNTGCVKAIDIGGACQAASECSRGTCSEGVCKAQVMPGQVCDNAHVCSASDCVKGVCMKQVAEGGDCRSSITYCKDGTCQNGFCKNTGSNPGQITDCTDTDGDTIGDEWDSCDVDTDNDTIPNCQDLDSDGDTLPDALEHGNTKCDYPTDTDYDDVFDFLSLDSDSNGIPDSEEASYLLDQFGRRYHIQIKDNVISVLDSNGTTVGSSIDPQSHQLLDAAGQPVNGLILKYPDLNNDGFPDFADIDNDGDGVPDKTEITGLAHRNYLYMGAEGPRGSDCDGDTLADNPGSIDDPFDCDNDTVPDYMSMDSDGDGIPDRVEGQNDSDKDGYYDRYAQDSDGDGIPDTEEFGPKNKGPIKSNPSNNSPDYRVADIDGDGLADGLEVKCESRLSCADASQVYCLSKCVDLQSDDQNCGSCGAACDSGQHCVSGACVASCDEISMTTCNNICVNTSDNPKYCGSCDTACSTNQMCMSGVCTDVYFTCLRASDTSCYGICVNLKNDDDNCGGCGLKCTDGKHCSNNTCVSDNITQGIRVIDGRYVMDSDGDGFNDAAEYVAAIATGKSPTYYICDATKGVKADPQNGVTEGAFEFYFELPYQGSEKDDFLNFKPQVSMLDVVFNLDTTKSMGGEVANLQQNIITKIYPSIKSHVTNSAFGVSRFDDFPTRPSLNSDYDVQPGYGVTEVCYGRVVNNSSESFTDTPYELLGRPETDENTVRRNVQRLGLHNGGDLPEAGYESLWQIVMGDDITKPQVSWYGYSTYSDFSSGSLDYATNDADRWGGAGFRKSSLPVVIHITDTTSHDKQNGPIDAMDNLPYDPVYVENAHYSDDVHQAYVNKGARIISIFRKDQEHASEFDGKVTGRRLNQLIKTSQATNAVVPVCAFKEDANSWMCGANKCCTEMNRSNTLVGVDPINSDQCVLSFGIDESNALADSLVAGVDALVKYATSQVAAVVRGEPIEGSQYDTSCFIKRVEAFERIADNNGERFGYVAPPREPETTCNPTAVPAAFNDADYNNGYSNFAIGTSSSSQPGAELNFKVIAQNDHCVPPKEQAQVFTAHIDIIDPVTGVSYGSRNVSIIVPGEKSGSVN